MAFDDMFEGFTLDKDTADKLKGVKNEPATPPNPNPDSSVNSDTDDDENTSEKGSVGELVIPVSTDEFNNSNSDDDDSTSDPDDSNSTPSFVDGVRTLLQETGLIEFAEDEEIKDATDLELAVQERLYGNVIKDVVSRTPQEARNLVAFILNKGDDLTTDDLRNFYTQHLHEVNIQDLNFTAEDTETAEQYVRERLSKAGVTGSILDTTINALVAENALIEKANSLLDEDKQQSKNSQAVNAAEQARLAKIQAEKEFANSVRSEILSHKWKKPKQSAVAEVITRGKIQGFVDKIQEDPQLFVRFAELLTFYNEKDGTFNFSELGKEAATDEVKRQKQSAFRDMASSQANNRQNDRRSPDEKRKKSDAYRVV